MSQGPKKDETPTGAVVPPPLPNAVLGNTAAATAAALGPTSPPADKPASAPAPAAAAVAASRPLPVAPPKLALPTATATSGATATPAPKPSSIGGPKPGATGGPPDLPKIAAAAKPAPASAKSDTLPKAPPATPAEPPSDGGRGRAQRRRSAGPSRTTIAANDDVPSIGGLIYALQQKPSQQPMSIAAIASAVWAVLGLLLGWAMLAPELARAPTFMEMLSRPTAITLAATILIPIALFWFLALLITRAQELRLMSSAMTEVAIRLAEPDRMAE
jgi:hypothetical protein